MTAYDDYGIPVAAYSEPDGVCGQWLRTGRAFIVYRIQPVVGPKLRQWRLEHWSGRKALSLVNVLIAVWFVLLYWGERRVYQSSVHQCQWDAWEDWVCVPAARSTCSSSASRAMQGHITSSSSPTRNSSTRTPIPAGPGRSTG